MSNTTITTLIGVSMILMGFALMLLGIGQMLHGNRIEALEAQHPIVQQEDADAPLPQEASGD